MTASHGGGLQLFPLLEALPGAARAAAPALRPLCVADGPLLSEDGLGAQAQALDALLRELGGTWLRPSERPGRGGARAFAHAVLRPLFHCAPGAAPFSARAWAACVEANRRAARAAVSALRRGDADSLWAHDVALALVPAFVREELPESRIAVSLYQPFPPFEIFRTLPVRTHILEGLLAAGLVGFLAPSHREAFFDSARRLLGARVDRAGNVEHRARRTRTAVVSPGVDVPLLQRLGADRAVRERAARLHPDERLVLAADPLDALRGLPQRVHAFELLLQRHPEHRGRVVLAQLLAPAHDAGGRALRRDLEAGAARVNRRRARPVVRLLALPDDTPARVAWYLAADVALVMPLREGASSVASEYVAVRGEGDGALVLSEFSGSAEELPQAWVANAYSAESVADALHSALAADAAERERRLRGLAARVLAADARSRLLAFIARLAE